LSTALYAENILFYISAGINGIVLPGAPFGFIQAEGIVFVSGVILLVLLFPDFFTVFLLRPVGGEKRPRGTRKGLKRKSRRLYRGRGKVEELERKARFPARSAGNAPKIE
jgi:hypothetical protein